MKKAVILLVEDNDDDVELTCEALRQNKLANDLHVVRDGAEALDFLYRRGAHANAPRPDLVLLDLNLPKVPGHQVLARIKTDDILRSIPVVVMTTSRRDEDVVRSYELHCNAFVSKPVDMLSFVDIVQKLSEFWFMIVSLPRGGPRADGGRDAE
jgi:CheY-like chemotaxis protein